jgi:hypothetical protein
MTTWQEAEKRVKEQRRVDKIAPLPTRTFEVQLNAKDVVNRSTVHTNYGI